MHEFLSVPLDVEPWFFRMLKLIVQKADKDGQIIFIYTYNQYSTPEDLFLAAEELYLNTGFDIAKCAKLAAFLYLWLNTEEQLDRKLRRKVLDLAKLYNPSGSCTTMSKAAKRFRLSLATASYQKFKDTISLPPIPISPPCSLSQSSPRGHGGSALSFCKLPEMQFTDILKYGSGAIAKQMTLIDFEIVSAMNVTDLRNKILHPDVGKWESVSNCSSHFNKMSFWVATQIIIAPNCKTRAEIIEKFISISAKLYKYRNFHGVYQVLSGLRNVNVRRLKTCWKNVSQRSMNILQRLEQAVSHINNYAQYRSNIKECQNKRVPAVPLICLILQDLTFINDGNEDTMSDGKVNFEKWSLFGSCMLNFTRLMETRYTFHKNSTIRRMLQNDLLILPETLLMKHSYAIEGPKRYPIHKNSF